MSDKWKYSSFHQFIVKRLYPPDEGKLRALETPLEMWSVKVLADGIEALLTLTRPTGDQRSRSQEFKSHREKLKHYSEESQPNSKKLRFQASQAAVSMISLKIKNGGKAQQ